MIPSVVKDVALLRLFDVMEKCMNPSASNTAKSLEEQTHQTFTSSDKLLQALISVPEKTSLELGITLNVNGLLITGFIISQET
jgi:hypothetical protein